MIGLDRQTLMDMELWEFFAAWDGWLQSEKNRMEAHRNHVYGAARFQAAASAWSSEQSKKIGKHRFPWEKGAGSGEPLGKDQIGAVLSLISKPARKN